MSINSRSEVDSVKLITADNNRHTTSVSEADKPLDEHSLIAEYCRMIQDRCHDASDSNNIETNIKELESEREALMAEFKDLTQKVPSSDLTDLDLTPPNLHLDEETKNLKAQTVRMEARMKILLDHNHQLESQLKRLRELVNANNKNEGQFGTLQSRSVVAQDLHIQSPNQNYTGDSVRPRLPPPLNSSREDFLNGVTDDDDDEANGKDEHSLSSLDLSIHDTLTVDN